MQARFPWTALLRWDLNDFQLSARDAALVRARWLSVTSCLPGGGPVALRQGTNAPGQTQREER